jgi:hypothetical protein
LAIERLSGKITKGETTIHEGDIWITPTTDPKGFKGWRGGFSTSSPPNLESDCRVQLADGRSGNMSIKSIQAGIHSLEIIFQGTGPLA